MVVDLTILYVSFCTFSFFLVNIENNLISKLENQYNDGEKSEQWFRNDAENTVFSPRYGKYLLMRCKYNASLHKQKTHQMSVKWSK